MDTPLPTIWLQKIVNYPSITTSLNCKYLNQLLLLTTTPLEQIILPNKTTMMNEKEFQQYHKKSTPTIKKALKIAAYLFCVTGCINTCRLPCNIHQQTYTLLPDIINQPNQNFFHTPLLENNSITDM